MTSGGYAGSLNVGNAYTSVRTGLPEGDVAGSSTNALIIDLKKKPATKTTFSGDRLCFSLWLCPSLNFAALQLMTRLFQPNGLFDQVSGKRRRPATKFLRPCCFSNRLVF